MPYTAAAATLTTPIALADDWRQSLPNDALAVLSRMRDACLEGAPRRSDRQPCALRVVDNTSGPPYVWLHIDEPTTAISRDTSNLRHRPR